MGQNTLSSHDPVPHTSSSCRSSSRWRRFFKAAATTFFLLQMKSCSSVHRSNPNRKSKFLQLEHKNRTRHVTCKPFLELLLETSSKASKNNKPIYRKATSMRMKVPLCKWKQVYGYHGPCGYFRQESCPELFHAFMRKLNESNSLLMKTKEHNWIQAISH